MTNINPKRNDWWKPVLLLVIVAAMLAATKVFHLGDKLGELKAWIGSLGAWGPVVYVFIYILAVITALPGSAITLFAGALFGSVLGTVVVSIGSTLGAAMSFLIARYFARGAVEGWAAKNEKFKKLDEMTARQGPAIVAITRLVPLFPFNLLNYGFGLTKVGFWQYVLWSWVCMLPGTILYVVGADALTKGLSEGKIPWPLVGALVVILTVLSVVVKIAKKKLAAKG
jgi:uncharacterized membrane protein YdjX (TVP38/TMEM64 family)